MKKCVVFVLFLLLIILRESKAKTGSYFKVGVFNDSFNPTSYNHYNVVELGNVQEFEINENFSLSTVVFVGSQSEPINKVNFRPKVKERVNYYGTYVSFNF